MDYSKITEILHKNLFAHINYDYALFKPSTTAEMLYINEIVSHSNEILLPYYCYYYY